jgi:hypothetical protein
MPEANEQSGPLLLRGMDGANPLGFLAAVGTLVSATARWPEARMSWDATSAGWRPRLLGCGTHEETFSADLHRSLSAASMDAFLLDDKLPFTATALAMGMRAAQLVASQGDRRTSDLLAALGCEMLTDKNGHFTDTRFCMVRSGDAAGQGLCAYARMTRSALRPEDLQNALFGQWHYQDTGPRLRWDPIEDRDHALRWNDPSKTTRDDWPGIMIGANSLALEALALFPVFACDGNALTTGLMRSRDRPFKFVWPIWSIPVGVDVVRSLVALPALRLDPVRRDRLTPMGIVDIFRSTRVQPSKYYSNFTPGVSVE